MFTNDGYANDKWGKVQSSWWEYNPIAQDRLCYKPTDYI